MTNAVMGLMSPELHLQNTIPLGPWAFLPEQGYGPLRFLNTMNIATNAKVLCLLSLKQWIM